MDPERTLAVPLTYAEVVVLFDLLHRWEDDGTLNRLPYADPAEQRAMWNLTATLEPLMNEALSDGYLDAVHDARQALGDEPS
ncbi:MAG TPA: hypothetical protein VE781_16030 [Kineosporiaceae bacterium]|jgi:hypothetical protein|nr:hypothetical protein [Kineosporiaceae bacterium]